MRIIINASLLIILTLVSEAISFDLKCSFIQPNTCTANDLVITSPNDVRITSVNGSTELLNDVDKLIIRDQRVYFVPRNIVNFFPLLKHLEISNSHLEWIEEDDFKQLSRLETLDLKNNNLEMLENGLFDSNPSLESINLHHNQLKFVPREVFAYLDHLRFIDLEENNCFRHYSFNKPYDSDNDKGSRHRDLVSKEHVMNELHQYCQSWEVAYYIYRRKYERKITTLQSEKKELTHRLRTCDGNLGAALTNYRQQKLMNSNMESMDQPMELLMINLRCIDVECNAIEFKIPFSNSLVLDGNYKTMNIRSLKINHQQTLFLPQNFAETFPDLKELTVTESGLSEVKYNVLKGLDLFTLNLPNNKIPEIPTDTFSDLENLKELDLSSNRIQTLHGGVFASLKNLEKLYLNENYLTSISMEILNGLDSLNALFLQNNRLEFIGASLFTKFTSLESLDLTNNVCINTSYPTTTLVNIEEEITQHCIAPVELNCKMGHFDIEINDDNFCQVQNMVIEYEKTKISKLNGVGPDTTVKTFYAKEQSMKFFPFELSHQMPHLLLIEIQQSNLTSLHTMDFAGFSELIHIVINGNNLSSISQGAFNTIPQLEILDLSSNNIISLPNNIFSQLTLLRTLLLSNNQLVRFTANFLPRTNMIQFFMVDNNQLNLVETKTVRLLRRAKLIDLSGNVCIDMKFTTETSQNGTRILSELVGEIELNCSAED